jgi:hypothetical protein
MKGKKQVEDKTQPPPKHQWQGIDKAPGEEMDKGEKITPQDIKGKKIDADLSILEDQPSE